MGVACSDGGVACFGAFAGFVELDWWSRLVAALSIVRIDSLIHD